MRIRKIPAVALLAVAAGLSLTACGSNGGSTTAASAPLSTPANDGVPLAPDSSGSSGTPQADPSQSGQGVAVTGDPGAGSADGSGSAAGTGGSGSADGTGAGAGSGSGTSGGGMCLTSNLSFTAGQMTDDKLVIDLTNQGAGSCTMHGFPGVDLQSDSGTVSARRSGLGPSDVTVQAGRSTAFTLHFAPGSDTGGAVFTGLLVTPPNETHSHAMDLVLSASGSDVVVDPVGADG